MPRPHVGRGSPPHREKDRNVLDSGQRDPQCGYASTRFVEREERICYGSSSVAQALGAPRERETLPIIVQVVGRQGSGKPLALTRALRELRRRGARVAVLKHSHHSLDLRGKDTDRLVRSGADAVVFASSRTIAFVPGDAVRFARSLPVDVVLVEVYHGRHIGRRWEVRAPGDATRLAHEIVSYVAGRLPSRLRPVRRR
ncbi:MAG: molybdopterin-guanine dinucleotide biosynthesis protein MobB [Thermoplasmata archaeon]